MPVIRLVQEGRNEGSIALVFIIKITRGLYGNNINYLPHGLFDSVESLYNL